MNSGMGSFARRNIGRCTQHKRHDVCMCVYVYVCMCVWVGVDIEMRVGVNVDVGVGVCGPCTCHLL